MRYADGFEFCGHFLSQKEMPGYNYNLTAFSRQTSGHRFTKLFAASSDHGHFIL
jgi:hypothetical protein